MLLPFFHNKFCEAGIDEAGRGCFAGPVFAAAVILPKDFYHPLLNDSKQLTKVLGVDDVILSSLTGLDNFEDGSASNWASAQSMAKIFAYMYENFKRTV